MHKIRAIGDRVVVRRDAPAEKIGAIIVPDQAKQKPVWGVVVTAGDGKQIDGVTKVPLEVKKGDRVLFGEYAGTEVKLEGAEPKDQHVILREDDILLVIDAE